MFGVVEHPRDESIKNWNAYFGQREALKTKQFGVYINSSSENIKRYGGLNDNDYLIGKTGWNPSIKGQGTLVFVVNFEAKEIKLSFNDKDLGVIFRNIPDKVFAAVAMRAGFSLTCTKHDFFD